MKLPPFLHIPFSRPRSRGKAAEQARRRRLRKLVGAALPERYAVEVAPARLALGISTTILLAALLCIHLWPNRIALRLGDIADREIMAQRSVSYEDTEATRQLRDDAAARVDKRYDVIPDATTNALDSLRIVFEIVNAASRPSPVAKADMDVRARAIAGEIRQQANVFVALPDVEELVRRDTLTRDKVRAVAVRLVEKTMARAITDDTGELPAVKRGLESDPLLAGLPVALRKTTASVAGAVVMPTRRYDPRATDRERQSARSAVVPPQRRSTAGTAIIRSGERVRQWHLDAFAALGLQNAHLDALTIADICLMVSLLIALVTVYLRQFHRALYNDTSRLLLLALISVISVVGLKIGSTLLGLPFSGVHFGYLGMMCVASAGMVIALLLSPRVATLVVALLSVASGLILNNELRFTLITLGSSLVGIVSVSTLRNRTDLLRATLFLCGSNAVLNVLVGQLEGDLPSELLSGMVWGVVSGLFALVLFWLGVAVFEKPFGITTHLRLLELSDPATPILQQFRLRVPGTYAHSLMVGNLAHAAAEAIGADGLLVRVAAYYHDLGKMNRPEFYIENQSNAENIHDRINPSLSALVLAAHVKEGLEIAQEVGLPPLVREVIQQHHGTTLMKYFYHRACGGTPNSTLEAQFRYPGPKPQTKEAAILMLADGVEAASRTLERPTPARLADFVARMVEDKRADGQLDDCDLTLRDLKTIQDVFARTLSGTLHARIEYPGEKEKPAPVTVTQPLVLVQGEETMAGCDLLPALPEPYGNNDTNAARPARREPVARPNGGANPSHGRG